MANRLAVSGSVVAFALATSTAALAQQPQSQGQPGIPFSGATPDPGNQAMIDALKSLGTKPYHTLTPAEGRSQPSFADAISQALRASSGRTTAPAPTTQEQDVSVRGAAGNLHALAVRPGNSQDRRLPVIVYFHGGGWVLTDSRTYIRSARALADKVGALVISVDYRRAPESPFPAQHDDALAAYRYILQNASKWGGDPANVALAGESAGGNLAVATAMLARDAGLLMPRHILSVYPIAGSDLNTPSYQDSSNAIPLNRALMAWFFRYTLSRPEQLMDPRINLVGANLQGLPPTTIISAEIDPLRSEGAMLAQHMTQQGVSVERREYPGTTHEFFGADALVSDARDAQDWAAQRLRAAFGSPSSTPPTVPPMPMPEPERG